MFKTLLMTACLLLPSSAMALRADLNGDGRVDFQDLAILAEEWLMSEQYGPNLVTNGDCSGLTVSPWVIVGDEIDYFGGENGYLEINGNPAGQRISQPINIIAGQSYRVTYQILDGSYSGDGTVTVYLGDTAGTVRATEGVHTETIIAAGTPEVSFVFGGAMLGLELDNISVEDIHETGILTDIEDWAVTTLSGLTENGAALFRTVEPWLGQIGMGASGIESFDRHAPFAFVQAQLMRPRREGGYDANIRIELSILIGQNSLQPYICRRGDADTVGTNRMFEKVFLAFDAQHPGGSIVCDEFYLTRAAKKTRDPAHFRGQLDPPDNVIKN